MKIAIPISEADGPVRTDLSRLSDERLRDACRMIRDEMNAGHDNAVMIVLISELIKVEREMTKRGWK